MGDDIRLDIVAGDPRAVGAGPALSNSFGFGGHNASLIIIPAS
jgi:3-oxoacyl-[acyl-carrier-protein] synthase II